MFATLKTDRELTFEELKEAMILMENQETTDRYQNAAMHISGDYADIDVAIDIDGNVTVL